MFKQLPTFNNSTVATIGSIDPIGIEDCSSQKPQGKTAFYFLFEKEKTLWVLGFGKSNQSPSRIEIERARCSIINYSTNFQRSNWEIESDWDLTTSEFTLFSVRHAKNCNGSYHPRQIHCGVVHGGQSVLCSVRFCNNYNLRSVINKALTDQQCPCVNIYPEIYDVRVLSSLSDVFLNWKFRPCPSRHITSSTWHKKDFTADSTFTGDLSTIKDCNWLFASLLSKITYLPSFPIVLNYRVIPDFMNQVNHLQT